ncbi:hypothetical protein KP509_38G011100 [Ceratopteris richardii]|uniref:Uncharacterized protein n=1 Tax=Ceratopteris richardii TaxID=49495 RepID=A0A8T2Q2K3_CERRI|nr:hypothetical protein KP509_38G011100 [Ceratopteris richardii]
MSLDKIHVRGTDAPVEGYRTEVQFEFEDPAEEEGEDERRRRRAAARAMLLRSYRLSREETMREKMKRSLSRLKSAAVNSFMSRCSLSSSSSSARPLHPLLSLPSPQSASSKFDPFSKGS